MTAHILDSPPAMAARNFTDAQVELFVLRTSQIADRVMAGDLAFLDGIDLAYSAAIWSGLVDRVGDDAIQKILAACFATARGPT